MLPLPAETDALIHRIYDAALDPARWTGVLDDIIDACGGCGGLLFTPLHAPAQGGVIMANRVSQASVEIWAAQSMHEDIFLQTAIARGTFREGTVVNGDELIPRDALVRTRFYRDLWEPIGVGRVCSGVVFDSTDTHKLPTVLSIFRRLSDPPFEQNRLALLQQLLRHLSRALGVMFHLRIGQLREACSTAALDRLACGVVLLDAHGSVHFMNAAARAHTVNGSLVRREHCRSLAADRLALAERLQGFEARFRRTIASALHPLQDPDGAHEDDGFSSALVLPAADGAPGCVVHAAPLGAGTAADAFHYGSLTAPRAILFLYDLSAARSLPPKMLSTLFDLTAAEARAALQSLRGGTTEDMAHRLGISPNTLKTQLQAVYGKTRTHRQADLLKLLLTLASR